MTLFQYRHAQCRFDLSLADDFSYPFISSAQTEQLRREGWSMTLDAITSVTSSELSDKDKERRQPDGGKAEDCDWL